ncbi:MAG: DUF1549 domain-containing protein [Candidatus Sumerlaeia bacterium]|nr:DUF1549 domain-containing protein [Candidatus Sumerlaeia bacterium]
MKKLFPVLCLSSVALSLLCPLAAQSLTPQAIDESLNKAYLHKELVPAAPADDAAFLRRLSLDVRGVIPTVEETIAFLQDESPTKREQLTQQYINDPLRSEHWADYWDKVLVGVLEQPDNVMVQSRIKTPWKQWVTTQFEANVPYDAFAREIISAQGEYPTDADVFPISRWRDAPENMAGTMSRVFLGQQIQCAQCHDHKTNPDLTQEKFWEFASFFATTRVTPVRNDPGMGQGFGSIYVKDGGMRWEHKVPDSTLTVVPTYLDGTKAEQRILDENGAALTPAKRREMLGKLREWNQNRQQMMNAPGANRNDVVRNTIETLPEYHDTRRDQLAQFLTVNDREQFARNFVNRLWARYFGRGFLDPVDEWGTGAQPVQAETLEMLTQEFIASGFNVKHMEWLLVNTAAYQRSSEPTDSSREFPDAFAHALVRPLSPEQLLDSYFRAMSVPEPDDTGTIRSRRDQVLLERYQTQFIQALNNDEMEWINTFETSVPKSLFLINDEGINKGISGTKGNLLDRIATSANGDAGTAVDYLYLGILSRYPSPEERERFSSELAAVYQQDPREARYYLEDLSWALLNSTEFVTNH